MERRSVSDAGVPNNGFQPTALGAALLWCWLARMVSQTRVFLDWPRGG